MKKILAAIAVLAVLSAPVRAADCSGTIATGGTAQDIFASGNVRTVLLQNNSANVMCFSISGTATLAGTNCGSGSYGLSAGSATVAGGLFASPAQMAISRLSVISATTGDRYSCERQ